MKVVSRQSIVDSQQSKVDSINLIVLSDVTTDSVYKLF